jgi:ubiquinone/menaquinone biosynthesis C-methylase UbiE
MNREVDALTSSTLKHLRDRWWDDIFTAFVKDTVQPRPGQRILDVGCGTGTAEKKLSRLRISQVEIVAVDLVLDRVREARATAQAHNINASFAAADACLLPFTDGAFDSAFCVAVLQHIGDVPRAIRELARVTRGGGRVVAVEPDNAGRYFFSSSEAGKRAYEIAGQFFASLSRARGDATDPSVGPKLPGLFAQHGITPLAVQIFPVSRAQLGVPAAAVWNERRETVREAVERAPDEAIRRLGRDYLKVLDGYAEDARAAGAAFVEIQNTMLFATVGQRNE